MFDWLYLNLYDVKRLFRVIFYCIISFMLNQIFVAVLRFFLETILPVVVVLKVYKDLFFFLYRIWVLPVYLFLNWIQALLDYIFWRLEVYFCRWFEFKIRFVWGMTTLYKINQVQLIIFNFLISVLKNFTLLLTFFNHLFIDILI